jgi:hypothetical protein
VKDDTRPILIGMNNPVYPGQPEFALYPYPPGCTGERIWEMINERTPLSKQEYLRAFDRRNLVDSGDWRPGEAADRAAELLPDLRGREIVLLGSQVRRAFGLPALLIHPLRWRGVRWRQIPHPSGRNLWYNDPTCRALVAMLLSELYVSVKEKETT